MSLTRTERDAVIIFVIAFGLPHLAGVLYPSMVAIDPLYGVAYAYTLNLLGMAALLVLVLSGSRRVVRAYKVVGAYRAEVSDG